MYTFNRLDNAFTALPYQRFTFSLFRPLLAALKPGDSLIAIAASDSNKPIGLALAQILPDSNSALVFSIFVEPNYRCQGIGTELLNYLEKELISQGCTSAKLIYTSGQPTTVALERLLQKRNWTPPAPRMLVCQSTIDKIINAPWMKRTEIPDSYSIFPWKEITQYERLALDKEQEISAWIPTTLIPFKHEEKLEPLNSLGLRYQGQVVGWMITHRIAPDTIRYTCGFLRPDLQKMARFIPLLVKAIQLQAKANIINCSCAVSVKRDSMANFVKKRMAPYLTALKESRESVKFLIEG
ncbi:MAG TPA: GNAT family N-acetyltransferase [Cyanobacteria bacterium UBA11372]|nr:GNAT family N-acetyltransferase [Cyanobacteria bacterium UBA11372]HBE36917.1 GNAT family N-acetyltransferase [Cyanobacteria bacterium UBA11368]HBE51757.1 GNAT family N-acetyltransferase [Cyanobacteria bacterium UBA11369]